MNMMYRLHSTPSLPSFADNGQHHKRQDGYHVDGTIQYNTILV